jgi:hypothetical protein
MTWGLRVYKTNGQQPFNTGANVRGTLLIDIVYYAPSVALQRIVVNYPNWAGRTIYIAHYGSAYQQPGNDTTHIEINYANGYPQVSFPTYAEVGGSRTAYVFVT